MQQSPPPPPQRRYKPSLGDVPSSYYGPLDLVTALTSDDANNVKFPESAAFTVNNMPHETSIEEETPEIEEKLNLEDIDDNIDEDELELRSIIPETIIGEGVEIVGDLEYTDLLHINGIFRGRLISQGSLIIGSRAVVTLEDNHRSFHVIIVKGGSVLGNLSAEKVILYENSKIVGNITCKSLHVRVPRVVIQGMINVNPFAPEIVDEHGDIIVDDTFPVSFSLFHQASDTIIIYKLSRIKLRLNRILSRKLSTQRL